MKNYFKKVSIMFAMSFVIVLGSCVIAFADDNGVVGTANLNNTSENSAKIGVQLTAPEKGWKRYDDDSSNISVTGALSRSGDSYFISNKADSYNKTVLSTPWKQNTANDSFSFGFYGSKLRLISPMWDSCSGSSEVYIDNVLVNKYSAYTAYSNSGLQKLVYEISGLSLNKHSVKVVNSGDGYFTLDAIDIDQNGYLMTYSEATQKESITLDKSSMDFVIGDSQSLVATIIPAGATVNWTSSDSSIATVDSTGKVTGIKEGVAIITATINGSNLSATCTVNVTNPITPTIALNKTSDSLVAGQTDNLVATTTPAGVQVTWKSSDESIATVDSTGKVTALKEGQATITATTADGLTAKCAITVTPKTADPTPDPDPTDSEKIVNIAHAKGDNTNNAGGDVTIIFHGAADTILSVVKTADVKEVWVGDNFTYTIVVTNTGTKTAKAVVVNDPAPNHIDFVVNGITTTQGKIDPSSTSKNIIVNVGDIAPGATVTIKVPATVIL